MFFAVGLADFDFFAAEMEVFVFGVADGPAAGMVVQIGQRSFAAVRMAAFDRHFGNRFELFFLCRFGTLFFFGLDRCRFFFFCRFGRNGFFFENFVFFLNRGRPSGELQAVNFADDGVFGNAERLPISPVVKPSCHIFLRSSTICSVHAMFFLLKLSF